MKEQVLRKRTSDAVLSTATLHRHSAGCIVWPSLPPGNGSMARCCTVTGCELPRTDYWPVCCVFPREFHYLQWSTSCAKLPTRKDWMKPYSSCTPSHTERYYATNCSSVTADGPAGHFLLLYNIFVFKVALLYFTVFYHGRMSSSNQLHDRLKWN